MEINFSHMEKFLLTARNIIALALIGIVASLLGGVVMKCCTGVDVEIRGVAATAVMMLLMIVGAAIYDRAVCGVKQKTMLRFAGFDPIILLWGVLLIVSLSVVLAPLMRLLPDINRDVHDGVLPVLYVVVVAPILEEILFRAKLFSVLRSTLKPALAVVLSSLFFALMHGNIAVGIEAFFAGMVFSYIYMLKGSLFAPILLHIMNNAMAYVMISFSYQEQTIEDYIGGLSMFSTIYIVALVVVLWGAIRVAVTLRRANKIVENGGDLKQLYERKK